MSKPATFRNPMRSQPLDWLGTDVHSAGVLATARRLLMAENLARQALPATLAASVRACRLEAQCLTLAVPTAAHAAKLRQLGPRIVAQLRAAAWEIDSLKVRVQAGLDRPAPERSRRGTGLDPLALQAFDALQSELPAGPLADAVARLIRHHHEDA
ncbi:MAG: DciA family protein [Castellaniella sp.]